MSYQQEDWVDFLAMAEFSYNNSIHASTKVSPFIANYGFHPRFSISIPATSVNPSVETLPALYTMSIVTSPWSSVLLVTTIKIKRNDIA